MSLYSRWSLGSPLLVSTLSGVAGTALCVVSALVILFTHRGHGLGTEHIALIVFLAVVALLVVTGGLRHELKLLLWFADRNDCAKRVLDSSPATSREAIYQSLVDGMPVLLQLFRWMRWQRGVIHLLLFLANMLAFWSYGGMFDTFPLHVTRLHEILLIAATWLVLLPHAFLPAFSLRQLALCGLCDWPELPKWM